MGLFERDVSMEKLSTEKRRGMMLTALDELGGSGSTPEIREKTDIEQSHVWNDMDYLQGEDLVVKAGKEKTEGSGEDPNIYRLTEMGEAAAQRIQQEDGTLSEQIRKEVDVFADLQETVERQQQIIERLEAEQKRMKDNWNEFMDDLAEAGVMQTEDGEEDIETEEY